MSRAIVGRLLVPFALTFAAVYGARMLMAGSQKAQVKAEQPEFNPAVRAGAVGCYPDFADSTSLTDDFIAGTPFRTREAIEQFFRSEDRRTIWHAVKPELRDRRMKVAACVGEVKNIVEARYQWRLSMMGRRVRGSEFQIVDLKGASDATISEKVRGCFEKIFSSPMEMEMTDAPVGQDSYDGTAPYLMTMRM